MSKVRKSVATEAVYAFIRETQTHDEAEEKRIYLDASYYRKLNEAIAYCRQPGATLSKDGGIGKELLRGEYNHVIGQIQCC